MVRAIIAGRKTQTRRLATKSARAQAGAAGDRIYVREHWKTDVLLNSMAPRDMPHDASVLCLADSTVPTKAFAKEFGKHRQAMHMPRWASRITLLVSEVRIEPLLTISEADCYREGIWHIAPADKSDGMRHFGVEGLTIDEPTAGRAYKQLWNSLHETPGTRWCDNPEVVVTTFSVVKTNIDKIVSEGTAE
jgi:hypothetical protein